MSKAWLGCVPSVNELNSMTLLEICLLEQRVKAVKKKKMRYYEQHVLRKNHV